MGVVRVKFQWFLCARCRARVGHAPTAVPTVFCPRCAPSPDAERDRVGRRLLDEAGLLKSDDAG
jgi:hypothetical protein